MGEEEWAPAGPLLSVQCIHPPSATLAVKGSQLPPSLSNQALPKDAREGMSSIPRGSWHSLTDTVVQKCISLSPRCETQWC